ncbi:MAG: hypothetical protein ACLFQ6_13075 [Candidatus Sumerlaeia bacterium]
MLPDYFRNYPDEPEELKVSNAIARQIDGFGFRYYWALYDLREEDCAYRISDDGKSIADLIQHIWGLINWVHVHVYGETMSHPENILERGAKTLCGAEKLRKSFAQMADSDLQKLKLEGNSFWAYINMPLSDAIHHSGQVSIMRRGAGNPWKMDEFLFGKKKEK